MEVEGHHRPGWSDTPGHLPKSWGSSQEMNSQSSQNWSLPVARQPSPQNHVSQSNGQQTSKAEKSAPVVGPENFVEELLRRIQPAPASEMRRVNVARYVQDTIVRAFQPNFEVQAFMYGSVPLKTYLPDGDIDLAIFQSRGNTQQLRESWFHHLSRFLQKEEHNPHAPFRIQDVQVIYAEVKLVKCLVDNIVVDISFQSLGGLCTVNFLECIDRRIDDDHLFKRSIILVKAWCYYESRLLGAHHGLISTYALETMVLYIFMTDHKTMDSPFKVLHKFLNMFSKFDWEKMCLSLKGPIPLDTFPKPKPIEIEDPPEHILKADYLSDTRNLFRPNHLPAEYMPQTTPRSFQIKSLNIMDPLLPTNNLGRSVNRASFCRVKRALELGARRINELIDKEPAEASKGLKAFFRNTWNTQRIPPAIPQNGFRQNGYSGSVNNLNSLGKQLSALTFHDNTNRSFQPTTSLPPYWNTPQLQNHSHLNYKELQRLMAQHSRNGSWNSSTSQSNSTRAALQGSLRQTAANGSSTSESQEGRQPVSENRQPVSEARQPVSEVRQPASESRQSEPPRAKLSKQAPAATGDAQRSTSLESMKHSRNASTASETPSRPVPTSDAVPAPPQASKPGNQAQTPKSIPQRKVAPQNGGPSNSSKLRKLSTHNADSPPEAPGRIGAWKDMPPSPQPQVPMFLVGNQIITTAGQQQLVPVYAPMTLQMTPTTYRQYPLLQPPHHRPPLNGFKNGSSPAQGQALGKKAGSEPPRHSDSGAEMPYYRSDSQQGTDAASLDSEGFSHPADLTRAMFNGKGQPIVRQAGRYRTDPDQYGARGPLRPSSSTGNLMHQIPLAHLLGHNGMTSGMQPSMPHPIQHGMPNGWTPAGYLNGHVLQPFDSFNPQWHTQSNNSNGSQNLRSRQSRHHGPVENQSAKAFPSGPNGVSNGSQAPSGSDIDSSRAGSPPSTSKTVPKPSQSEVQVQSAGNTEWPLPGGKAGSWGPDPQAAGQRTAVWVPEPQGPIPRSSVSVSEGRSGWASPVGSSESTKSVPVHASQLDDPETFARAASALHAAPAQVNAGPSDWQKEFMLDEQDFPGLPNTKPGNQGGVQPKKSWRPIHDKSLNKETTVSATRKELAS